MSRLTTCSTIISLACGLALAGSVSASMLENPGAETGDLSGWTADDGVTVSQGAFSFIPIDGDWFFLMGEDVPMGEHTESMQQVVDVAGCSNEFITGEFTAAGWVATDADHWGTFTLDFGEGPIVVLDLLQSATPEEWIEFGPISGPVPNVDAITYHVAGSKADPDEAETAIQVAYDDLSLLLNCVSDFAKVSGRKGQYGKGNAPEWTFGGAVGTLDDGQTADAAIEINYRALGSVCTFTANDEILYTTDSSATISADYECIGGDKDEQTGEAVLDLTAMNASGCTAHANRDRGSIAVTADDSELAISGEFGETGGENCIDRGNVEIVAAEDDNGDDVNG
jgi:hypothetical protein